MLTINDNDLPNLSNKVYVLELRGTADESFASEQQNFAVTFIDPCETVTITPPKF